MLTKVKDVMTFPVHVVTQGARFKDIAAQLQQHRVGAMPVVDLDGRLVGIVSEPDLLLKEEPVGEERPELFESRRRRLQRSQARGSTTRQLMTHPPVTIEPNASLGQAARLMRERNIKQLPVVDENGILGVVSRGDLLKVYLRDDDPIERRADVELLLHFAGTVDRAVSVEDRLNFRNHDKAPGVASPKPRPGHALTGRSHGD